MGKKVLLIYPQGSLEVFSRSKIKVAMPFIPYISLASLAGALLKAGQDVKILDLNASEKPRDDFYSTINDFKPDFVGISFTSALSKMAGELAKKVKEINSGIMVIGGGVHPTTLPEETLRDYDFDVLCVGEGEETIVEIVGGKGLKDILGIAYKEDGKIILNPRRPLIANLDDLPMPAWHLYDLSKYHTPRLSSRKNPVGAMETSRGCPFGCCFCNKTVFAKFFRAKSPQRVVDEMEHILKIGFKEIHIWEDGFSTDLERAKEICRLIIGRGLKFPWNVYNGMRVDRLDEELLVLMKQAGCYQVSIGIESGNPQVLAGLGKNITMDQVRRAAKMVKQSGMECLGFFLLGLPGDTEETMLETINFAKELDLDLAKVGILMPLPGTPIFEEWDKLGLIKSRDWSRYIFHDSQSFVYEHPNLSYKTIRRYYDRFYRELYLTPHFIMKRFWRGLKNGDLFFDAYYFLKTLPYGWFSSKN